MSYNWFDYVLIAIIVASIGAGFLRGFIKEVIAVIAWVAAIFIASKFATPLASLFTSSPQIQSTLSSASSSVGFDTSQPVSLLALGISFVCIFVGVLIIGKIVGYLFSGAAQVGGMTFVNGLLGGIFGFVRGLLVVTVLLFLLQLTSAPQQNFWTESKLVLSFQPGIQWINDQVLPGIEVLKNKAGESLKQFGFRFQENHFYR